MRKIKTFVALLLICCCFAAMVPQTMAETAYSFEPESWQLHRLGLYTGTSAEEFIPDLGAKLDRQIGVALLLNYFGKRNEVLKMTSSEVNDILSQFSDQSSVYAWARPYMAYAVKNAIILGTSAITLDPLGSLDGTAFATMLLRRIGYPMEGMTYLQSLETLYEKGGLNSAEISLFNKPQFLKNDAVGMAYTVLYARCSDGEAVIESLIRSGVVSADKAFSQKLIRYNDPGSVEAVNPAAPVIPRPTRYDEIYYRILDAIENEEPSIKLPMTPYTDTSREVFDMVDRILLENPGILYYSGCTYSITGLLTFQYSKDREVSEAHSAILQEKLKTILNRIIVPDMSDYQKELAIHDYIVNECDYDFDAYEKGDIPPESYNAYGVLCLKTAVCEGYAEAAKLLLNLAGVDCGIMTGTSKGEGHAWNIITISGQYYQLDVTWDDPILEDGTRTLSYHYFNLTDADMGIDHEWDSSLYPACNATEFNYYTYNKLIVPSQDAFIDMVVQKVESGTREVTVKVENYGSIAFDYGKAVREVCNQVDLGCTIMINKDQGIFDLDFN